MPGAITYPITALVFDGVTVGAYTDVFTDLTLLLGTEDGLDDLGRIRVQNVATPTTIPVGRTSEGLEDGTLTVQDNAYITVLDDLRVWSKPVYIADNGDIFKDSDVAVGTWTTNEPPVANTGPAFAATIDSITGLITVQFPAGGFDLSFAVADGATITGYAWDVADGTITVGSASTAVITATFPAGVRYVSLTVTDSNAVTHTARSMVYAHDPDNDMTLQHYTIERHHAEQSGQELDIRILDDLSRSTYPDGTLVMFWDGEPLLPTDRSNMMFVGWEQSLSTNAQGTRTSTLKDTVLHCVDVAGRLQALGSFEQSLERAATPANFSEMVNPTMDKYIHYLLHWHSTALAVADYFPSDTGDDYPFVLFGSNGSSLWEQVANEAKGLVPGHLFTCNRRGQLAVTVDPFLQDPVDRTAAFQGTFDEDNTEQITFDYTRPPKVARIRGAALLTATDYTIVDGVPTLLTVQCVTPGFAPSQGMVDVQTNEGLARSQAALNSAKGHEYARANSRYGMINLTPVDDSNYSIIDPGNLDWLYVNLTVEAAALRGFAFTNVRCQCKSVDFRYSDNKSGVVRRSQFVLEPETVGRPAITVIPEGSSAVPVDPIPPPDMGLITGQEVVAGIGKFGRYLTFDFQTPSGSGGPTYVFDNLTGADEMLTWVVDPFSPGYAPGATSGSVDGWAATATALYRLTDICSVSPSATAVVTFANTALWRTVQASFGAYFFAGLNPWLICVSYYGSLGGHTGTWATYSKDGGATWAAEVQVSAFYDSGGAVNPVALFTSPRTPGYALTAAHTATASPGVTHGFVTQDWGATWTEMTATEDPAFLLPAWGEWSDLGASIYTYLGLGTRKSISLFSTSNDGSVQTDYELLLVAPPKDTKRMIVQCDWSNESTASGLGSQGAALALFKPSSVGRTGSKNFTQAVQNTGPLTGSFTCEYTFSGFAIHDWPISREEIIAADPDDGDGILYRLNTSANGYSGNTRSNAASIVLTVTELETDAGVVYTPTDPGLILPIHGSAGEFHLPWEDNADEGLIYYGSLSRTANRLFDLKKVAAGVLSSISPNDGSRDYGANHGQFAIRNYDNDRQKMVVSGTGNDTSGSSSGDKQGVWVSSSAGASWSNIVTPTTSTEPYSAAFGGDDSDVIFVWGPPAYIKYSSNFGSSLDDRSGNLTALSATHLIGIAGGPS